MWFRPWVTLFWSCQRTTVRVVFPGKSMDPHMLFHSAASNIISQVLFARQFDYEDEFMEFFVSLFRETSKIINGPWGMVRHIFFVFATKPLNDCCYKCKYNMCTCSVKTGWDRWWIPNHYVKLTLSRLACVQYMNKKRTDLEMETKQFIISLAENCSNMALLESPGQRSENVLKSILKRCHFNFFSFPYRFMTLFPWCATCHCPSREPLRCSRCVL